MKQNPSYETEVIAVKVPDVFGVKEDYESKLRYYQYEQDLKFSGKNSLYIVYGKVMEQSQRFERRLESIYKGFSINIRKCSTKILMDHVKDLQAYHFFQNDREAALLLTLLENSYTLKEVFFLSNLITEKDHDLCDNFFYSSYIGFHDGTDRLNELAEKFMENYRKQHGKH